MYFELSLEEVLERTEKKVKQQKNSYLERRVITYRLDMKTRPKKTSVGNIYTYRKQIKDIEQYKVVFYDTKEEIYDFYYKLIKEFKNKKELI